MNDRPESDGTNRVSEPPRSFLGIKLDGITKLALVGSFLLLSMGFLYLARDILLPISIAFLLGLVLSPVVRWLARRGIPAPASAIALVIVLLVGFTAIGFMIVGPVSAVINDAPRVAYEIRQKLGVFQRPVETIGRATARFEELVSPPADSNTEKVVIDDGGGAATLGYVATDAGQRLAALGLCLILILFILASGDLFQEKLIKVLPTLSDKKRGLRIAREIEREVSRYLFTVTFINIGLGIVTGTVFWLLGMPSPILWGIFATLANFLPFIGGAIVTMVSFGIAVVAFDTLGQALLPPLAFMALTAAEGQFITPMIVGQRHALNLVVIIVAIAFWGWIWGLMGALIAVPLLVTVKVFADHIEPFRPFGEFLSARQETLPDEEEG